MYMQKLDAMKAFRPNGWSGTKYMDNGEVRCKFYDKIQETKKKRELPKYGRENLPKNLLRYEVTFSTKGLSRLFGRDIVAEELGVNRCFGRWLQSGLDIMRIW